MNDDNVIRTWLEGRPFGHPIHPVLVHFPMGLFILSLVLDIASLVVVDDILVEAALYAIVAGIVMALLAALPGLVDYSDIRDDHPARKIATTHMILNITVVGLFAVNAILRATGEQGDSTALLPLALSLIAVGMLTYSGYLGGDLVYNQGIGVGRHRRESATPKDTIIVNVDPGAVEDYVEVVPLDRLEEGASIRANVNGHVMTIARMNGDVYAFQEFCTHRFGPLSEGHFDGNKVVCPWHFSCFDMQTGEVVQGPAKVDLKTYDARIVGDVVQVRVPV